MWQTNNQREQKAQKLKLQQDQNLRHQEQDFV